MKALHGKKHAKTKQKHIEKKKKKKQLNRYPPISNDAMPRNQNQETSRA